MERINLDRSNLEFMKKQIEDEIKLIRKDEISQSCVSVVRRIRVSFFWASYKKTSKLLTFPAFVSYRKK